MPLSSYSLTQRLLLKLQNGDNHSREPYKVFFIVRIIGKIPGGGNGNPLQYSCLRNPMDRGV